MVPAAVRALAVPRPWCGGKRCLEPRASSLEREPLRVVGLALLCGLLASSSAFSQEIISQPHEVSDSALPDGGDEAIAGEARRLSMEFQDAKLKDVLKVFSQETGISVIARADIGDRPITLYFEDVEVLDALDQILAAGGLTYERSPGSDIYLVKPSAEETSQTITRIYRLKYARVSRSVLARVAAAFSSRTPFEADLTSQGQGGGGGGLQEGVGVDLVLQPLLTKSGSVLVDGRTNSLIVTDLPSNFPRLEAALAALDIRTPQIMVDAEVIETTVTKLKELGVKWGTGTEGDLFSLDPATRETRFPFAPPFSRWLGDQGRSITDKPEIALGGIQFGTLGTGAAFAILQALETDAETKVLARPKVLTLDNESAVIRLSTEEAVGFQTSSQAITGSQTSTPERETTGVVLVVTPQVNQDSFITMMVEPSVTKTVPAKITAPSGQATPRDPKTRSSRTLVRIRSGDTLVVGGLIDRSEEETVRKVPILADLPFLGEAFKHTHISDTVSELIVFITPRLLEESAASRLASARPGPAQAAAQDPPGTRRDLIERALNALER